MADKTKIRGITIEIGGDTSGLNKALKDVNSTVKDTQQQLSDVKKLLKLDPGNTELLEQKQKLLGDQVKNTKKKLEELNKVEQQLKANGVEENSAQFMAVRREIIDTTDELERAEKAAKNFNVTLEKAGATADRVAAGAGKVAEKTESLSRAAQGVIAGAAGIATAAVKSYAENEQLIGGIETLFGKSSEQLMEYANNAYKTAGLSANQYMELSTSFAASLVQSLGGDTKKAADYADKAITDMADNANKMGSDIESIQNAYQGFAKGQYTLLDNLKLGYGGTATEMARLLNESGVLGSNTIDMTKDVGKQLSEVGFSTIIDAIHAVQTEMDITGTTAEEASDTISGSFESAKSAVQNLITGIGQENVDVDALTKNVIDAITQVFENVKPVLKNLWENLPSGVHWGLIFTSLVAAISPVAGAISKTMSSISSMAGLFQKLTPAISSFAKIAATAGKAIASFAATAAKSIGSAVATAGKAIASFAATAAKSIGSAVATAGKAIAGLFSQIVAFVAANPIALVIAAIVALVALIAAKGDEIKAILQKVDDFLQGVFARDWTEVFGPVLGDAMNGFFANIKNIWDAIKSVLDGVIDFIRGVFTGDWKRVWEGVKEIFRGIFEGLDAIVKAPLNGIIAMLNGIVSGINLVIRGLNKLPNVNIGEFGKIPYFANGGILSRGSAIVGEAGPELLTMANGRAYVQPLTGGGPSLGTVEGLLGSIRDSMGSGAPVNITVQNVLDGKVIGQTAYTYSQNRLRVNG